MKPQKKIHLVLMLIKWGALVVDGRGKLGGHVASQNKAGSYLRTKVTPSNPRTTFQTSARALFGAISAGWSGLGEDVIAAWNSAVPDWSRTNIFGDIKQPSGKALYQRLNNQAQVVGYPAVTAPPEKLEMVTGTLTKVVIDTGAQSIELTGAYAGAGAKVACYATPPVSLGTTFVKNRLRLFFYKDASAINVPVSYAAYKERFGTPATGDKIYVGIKYVLPNGQASPLQIVEAAIV